MGTCKPWSICWKKVVWCCPQNQMMTTQQCWQHILGTVMLWKNCWILFLVGYVSCLLLFLRVLLVPSLPPVHFFCIAYVLSPPAFWNETLGKVVPQRPSGISKRHRINEVQDKQDKKSCYENGLKCSDKLKVWPTACACLFLNRPNQLPAAIELDAGYCLQTGSLRGCPALGPHIQCRPGQLCRAEEWVSSPHQTASLCSDPSRYAGLCFIPFEGASLLCFKTPETAKPHFFQGNPKQSLYPSKPRLQWT